MLFGSAEKRIDQVVAFFARLDAELDRGVAECNTKREQLFSQIGALQERATTLRQDATNAGEAIGRAVRLKNGLKSLLQ